MVASTEAKKIPTDPSAYITYDDVIALALAKTRLTEFTADSNTWQAALYDIRETFKSDIKELNLMFFDTSRGPLLPPQSQEFYELISVLAESELISLPNPHYKRICMDEPQKQKVKELEEQLLAPYNPYIDKIAKILEDRLKLAV